MNSNFPDAPDLTVKDLSIFPEEIRHALREIDRHIDMGVGVTRVRDKKGKITEYSNMSVIIRILKKRFLSLGFDNSIYSGAYRYALIHSEHSWVIKMARDIDLSNVKDNFIEAFICKNLPDDDQKFFPETHLYRGGVLVQRMFKPNLSLSNLYFNDIEAESARLGVGDNHGNNIGWEKDAEKSGDTHRKFRFIDFQPRFVRGLGVLPNLAAKFYEQYPQFASL